MSVISEDLFSFLINAKFIVEENANHSLYVLELNKDFKWAIKPKYNIVLIMM